MLAAACLMLIATDAIVVIPPLTAGESLTGGSYEWSFGGLLYFLLPLAAIIIAARNLPRILSLGGKRKGFFFGCLLTYAVLAGFAALANVFLYYTYDKLVAWLGHLGNAKVPNSFLGIGNIMEDLGWLRYGAVVAFLQQFAFLLMAAMAAHTITAVQGTWIGWAADGLLVALLVVWMLKPVDMLEHIINLAHTFVFQSNAIKQILSCLALSSVCAVLSRLTIDWREIS
jgi:hypothetical protein